jgi:hypothetical protein
MALTKITPQMFDTSAAGHDFNIDNGTFVVDASANRVGIGTATPSTLLHVNGALTAGSIAIDNITIDGNEIDASSGHIVLDSADEIKLDAHSGIIRVQTQGGDIGMIRALNSDLQIRSMVADKDIVFHGDDGGSGVTALTLDMSEGGRAIFAAPVLTSAGSASAPSLSFSGDSNTGLYSVAADNIGFAVAGSARAFLSATQFNMTGNIVASGTVTVGNSNLGSNTSHLANLTINNNAYIGTTSTATAIQIATAGGVTFASSVKLSGQTSSDGLRLDLAGSTDYKIGETSTNDIVSFGAAGGAATQLIHHNISSGNVGIGIANPTNKFHVEYNTNASAANLAEVDNYSPIRFGDFRADSSDNLYFMSVGGGKVGIQARDNSANGAAKKLALNPYGGTVGVGIADPSANLEVRGAAANGQIYIGGSTTNTYGKIYSDNDGVLVLAADGGNNAANSYLALEIDSVARVAANTTGTVFGDVSVLADGMTGTPNDKNQAEIGPGYLRLKRDDTASAQQLTFDKNGSTHSYFETGTSGLIYVVNSGDHRFNADVIPNIADSYDLGTSALRWRNGYFNDFHLSNEGIEGGNDVDGTTGDWTIQEGEEHLYIINNKTGKKFRFALEEVT